MRHCTPVLSSEVAHLVSLLYKAELGYETLNPMCCSSSSQMPPFFQRYKLSFGGDWEESEAHNLNSQKVQTHLSSHSLGL